MSTDETVPNWGGQLLRATPRDGSRPAFGIVIAEPDPVKAEGTMRSILPDCEVELTGLLPKNDLNLAGLGYGEWRPI
jgi:hypothetical protein